MDCQDSNPPDEVMCHCSGTTRIEIQRLFEQGLVSMEAISRRTGAISGCGGCEWDIAEMLNQLADQQQEVSSPQPGQNGMPNP